MKSFLLSKLWLVIFGVAALFTSCNKGEVSSEELESYAEETVYRINESGNLGRFGCYEIVFPVTLTFPDGTVSEEINSYDELKTTVRTWRAANQDVRVRPVITIPFDVVNENGEVINIETVEQLRKLRFECRKMFLDNNGPNKGKPCFRLQYPLSIEFPNGTITEFADRRALQKALRQWRKDNPGSDTRPVMVFPINVIMEDGTVVAINSKEELKALKDSCD